MSQNGINNKRARLFIEAILKYETEQGDRSIKKLSADWAKDGSSNLDIRANTDSFVELLQNIPEFKPNPTTNLKGIKEIICHVLNEYLNKRLGILKTTNHRAVQKQRYRGLWTFTLKLWDKNNIKKNLEELDKLMSPHGGFDPDINGSNQDFDQNWLECIAEYFDFSEEELREFEKKDLELLQAALERNGFKLN